MAVPRLISLISQANANAEQANANAEQANANAEQANANAEQAKEVATSFQERIATLEQALSQANAKIADLMKIVFGTSDEQTVKTSTDKYITTSYGEVLVTKRS